MDKKTILVACAFGVVISDAAGQQPAATTPDVPQTQSSFMQQKPVAESTGVNQQQQKADLIFGDSLAEGMQSASHLPGDCKYGRPPSEIMKAIVKYEKEHPGGLKGKNIILSCGAANNSAEMLKVLPQQLKYLRDHGVKNVSVIGVSDKQGNFKKPVMKDGKFVMGPNGKPLLEKQDPKEVNDAIEKIVKKNGYTFAGAITNASKDGVHPKQEDYKELFKQAEKALNTNSSTTPVNNIKVKPPTQG